MRISLDASLLLYPNWSGVQVYTYRVIEAMTRLAGSDFQFYLHCDQKTANDSMKLLTSRANVERRDRVGGLRYHAALPFDVGILNADIYYSFSGRIKTPLPCPVVLTIYDNGKFVIPQFFDSDRNIEERHRLGKVLRSLAGIITISQSVRAEIVELFGVRSERNFVVPPAADRDDPALEDAKPTELETNKYILMVNPGRSYKNWMDVISGFAHYVTLNKSDNETALVLAGDLRGEKEAIIRARSELDETVARRIFLLGHVSDKELRYLYRNTLVVVLPSLYEGFGIPALEAMSYDRPLIISDIPVLREVAGEAAIRVQTGHPDDLGEAFLRISQDEQLRKALVDKGRLRLAMYSWESSGRLTLDILESLANKRRSR